jgi:hypothetical protein
VEQWNYLANQKQGAMNKYNWSVIIRLVLGSSRALWKLWIFQWIHRIGLMNLIEDFQCAITDSALVEETWAVKGVESCAPARKECNKCDLTAAPCFWLANHNDWSRWFAVGNLPHLFAASQLSWVFWVGTGLQKNEQTKTWMWKIFLQGSRL